MTATGRVTLFRRKPFDMAEMPVPAPRPGAALVRVRITNNLRVGPACMARPQQETSAGPDQRGFCSGGQARGAARKPRSVKGTATCPYVEGTDYLLTKGRKYRYAKQGIRRAR